MTKAPMFRTILDEDATLPVFLDPSVCRWCKTTMGVIIPETRQDYYRCSFCKNEYHPAGPPRFFSAFDEDSVRERCGVVKIWQNELKQVTCRLAVHAASTPHDFRTQCPTLRTWTGEMLGQGPLRCKYIEGHLGVCKFLHGFS